LGIQSLFSQFCHFSSLFLSSCSYISWRGWLACMTVEVQSRPGGVKEGGRQCVVVSIVTETTREGGGLGVRVGTGRYSKRTPNIRLYHLHTDNTEICFPILPNGSSSILRIPLPRRTDPSMGLPLSFSLDVHAADICMLALLLIIPVPLVHSWWNDVHRRILRPSISFSLLFLSPIFCLCFSVSSSFPYK
jgi:hypothetical protein